MNQLIILDDEITVGQTISHIARSESFQSQITTDNESFFSALSESSPTCIILDLIMPKQDGIQIISHLAEKNCQASILILSGADQRVVNTAVSIAIARGLNVLGKLQKPFTVEEMRYYLKLSTTRRNAAPGSSSSKQSLQVQNISKASLQQAIDNNEFTLQYQPQIHCSSRQLTGFEALSRWQHASYGGISPNLFIPAIENNGLMSAFTRQVTQNALHWFGQALDQQPTPSEELTLSVNVSAHNLADSRFASDIQSLCEEAGIAAQRITLELTESQALSDTILSAELLTQLRIMGFRISIDDFGCGYSSFVQLTRLPFSEIKIDRSFVSNAMESDDSRQVMRSIISLGKSLGLQCVAEGVEDAGTFSLLCDMGCDYAQGYYFSRPLDPDAATQLIRNGIAI